MMYRMLIRKRRFRLIHTFDRLADFILRTVCAKINYKAKELEDLLTIG